MEGTLWKWTNYFSGWQPRWFVLDNGILSYYKSQEDVNNGCRGSIKLSVCDVSVHPTDPTRLDLIIPGEQHFYVRASTAQERQTWLVALGSCKACIPGLGQTPTSGETTHSSSDLKSKKSELRLYCDLLMQQVHSVKSTVSDANTARDPQQLDEATSLLSATCDTFIKTLEDCMTLADANISYEVRHQHITDAALPSPSSPTAPPEMQHSMTVHLKKPRSSLKNSTEKYIPPAPVIKNKNQRNSDNLSSRPKTRTRTPSSDSSDFSDRDIRLSRHKDSSSVSSLEIGSGGQGNGIIEELEMEPRQVQTFFSTMPVSYQDIKLKEDGGIPVSPFLDACRALIPIFDKLGSTAFAPVKMDISGNIKKLDQKYSSNPSAFTTLQSIVLYEKSVGQTHVKNSATDALLWLKRALQFICEFLREVHQGEEDLVKAAKTAYEKSLKRFHGWLVQGVFSLALKAVPYRHDFIGALSASRRDFENGDFIRQITVDMDCYITALGVLVTILTDFYFANDLDLDKKV